MLPRQRLALTVELELELAVAMPLVPMEPVLVEDMVVAEVLRRESRQEQVLLEVALEDRWARRTCQDFQARVVQQSLLVHHMGRRVLVEVELSMVEGE